MTKKLEPGCKAITVNCLVPENNGHVVTVLSIDDEWLWINPDGSATCGRCVYIDIDLVSFDGSVIDNTIQEENLRRIDDKEETTTWESMRDLWVPEQVKTRELL